jgi:L-ascorbate metabolism protein UlaG (beta-lactamase superfamily)
MKLTRRKWLAGAGGLLAGGIGLEWYSLRGNFDHRSSFLASAGSAWPRNERALDRTDGVAHIGHSTHLVLLGGKRLLTDPWFYDPAFGALSHVVAPATYPDALGRLDAILISHDHADHADLRALAQMDKLAMVIVPTTELADKIRKLGFANVAVLGLRSSTKLGELTITAVEAVHDIYEIGFIVATAQKSVYFAGDTALNDAIAKIGAEFKPVLSILPCDGTRIVGGGLHVMRPEDAVVAAGQLGSRIIVPSHAEAYFSDPIAGTLLASTIPHAGEELATGIAKALPNVRCVVPKPAQIIAID